MTFTATVPGLPLLEAYERSGVEVLVRDRTERTTCPSCEQRLSQVGKEKLALWDLPWGWKPTQLKIEYTRWRCYFGCPQPHPLEYLYKRGVKATQRLQEALLDRHLRGASVAALSRWCGMPERSIWRVIQAGLPQMQRRLQKESQQPLVWTAATHIGIDEIMLAGHPEPVAVIVDLVSGRLLDVLPDRSKETVVSFFRELRQVRKASGVRSVLVIASDMWADYRLAIHEVFRNEAVQVVDHFHVHVKIAQDLQELALQVIPAHAHRGLQLRALGSDLLTAIQTGLVRCTVPDLVPEQRLPLERGLNLALDLVSFWRADDLAQANKRLTAWLRAVREWRDEGKLDPFKRLRYLIHEWQAQLLNYHDPAVQLPNGKPVTTALVENINGRLRRLEKQAVSPLYSPLDTDKKGEEPGVRVQKRFAKLWLRALYSINVPRPPRQLLLSELRPHIPDCSCGCRAQRLEVGWAKSVVVNDLPLGTAPVRAQVMTAESHCPRCEQIQTHEVRVGEGVTLRLEEALQRQVREGRLLSPLAAETGLGLKRLTRIVGEVPRAHCPQVPNIIGIQQWRWRRKTRWLITSVPEGQPVDLLPDAEVATLHAWLKPHTIKFAFVERPEWLRILPPSVQGVLDTFTAMTLVHSAMVQVHRRFTRLQPVAKLYSPQLRGHRGLLLSAQKFVQDRQQLQNVLATDRRLRAAHELTERYRQLLQADYTGIQAAEQALVAWCEQVARRTLPPQPDAMERAWFFEFKLAGKQVQDCRRAVALGMVARSQRRQLSLAAARRRRRVHRQLEAARGTDLETLRRALLRRWS